MSASPTVPGPQSEPRRVLEPDIAPEPPEESDLIRLLNALLRHQWLVLRLPVLLAVAAFLLTVTNARRYQSEAAFVPQQTQRMPSAVAGFAAQFGLPLGGDRLDQSPDFYADLVLSREILEPVVQQQFQDPDGGAQKPLIEIYGIDDDDANLRLANAVRRLEKSMKVSPAPRTGVVSFAVAAETPALAQGIAGQVIEQINQFNLRRRQTVAEAERSFVESRLEGARAELLAAESRLQRFDERNLRIDNSPELRLERDRLQRQIGQRQDVVNMLTQAHEQARIDEVRNTPAITVIERPSLAVRPLPRGSTRRAISVFIITVFLGAMFALATELYRRLELGESLAHEEFRRLTRWRRR